MSSACRWIFHLPPQGVLVAWLWDWEEESKNDTTADVESREQHNPESDKSDNETTQLSLPTRTRTVTFKCVGSTHDPCAQECLSKVSKLLREDKTVEVPEPNNQYGARAIAFHCKVNNEWKRIGYIVRECLEHVHRPMAERRITEVKLAWAKYLVSWSYSGPGFCAGVNITIRGEWNKDVIHSQSTH